MACCWREKPLPSCTNPTSTWKPPPTPCRCGRGWISTAWSQPEYESVVKQFSRRFSVSKAATEVLIAASRRDETAAGWIRESHAEVLHLAEAAMNQAMKGQPRAAVEALLAHGEETGNAKLIEMAGAVARRHQERIENVEGLLANAATLAHRYCTPSSHIAGVRRSNRSAGGLVLRRLAVQAQALAGLLEALAQQLRPDALAGHAAAERLSLSLPPRISRTRAMMRSARSGKCCCSQLLEQRVHLPGQAQHDAEGVTWRRRRAPPAGCVRVRAR
jgi:hypothetical protein